MKLYRIISRYEPEAYALLRIVAGFLFIWHGTQKYFNYPPLPPGANVPVHVVAIGGTVELIGGFLIITGLFTRLAAFIASGEMAYAFWIVHFPTGLLPLVNHGELAMLYCFLFFFIFIKGPGIWSLDYLISKKKATG